MCRGDTVGDTGETRAKELKTYCLGCMHTLDSWINVQACLVKTHD